MIAVLILLKASVIVAIAAVVLRSLGRRSSATSRHLTCTLAIAGLLALPILSFVLPGWTPIEWSVSDAISGQSTVELEGPPEGGQYALLEGSVKAGHYVLPEGPVKAGHYVLPDGPPEGGHYVLLEGPAKGGHYVLSAGPARVGHYVLNLLVLVYVLGVLLLAARVLIDRFRVRRLVRQAKVLCDPAWLALHRDCASELGVDGDVQLLRSEEQMTPMAVGIRHRAILIPALADEWPYEMRRAVLLHEFAHIVRHDCLTQTAAAVACALYWIHPGLWWVARRLRIERELACDDRVLSAGADAHEYAGHLLELSYTLRGGLMPALAVGMAAPRQLETRVIALLDRARNRTLPTRRSAVAALALGAALIVPISAATTMDLQPADRQLADRQNHATDDVSSESLGRFLSVDYWRHMATDGLNRLANEWAYLNEMRQLGYSIADVNVLFQLRQHGVTPYLVRALAAEGLSGLSTDELLTAVRHGVTPDYIHDLKSLGYQPLDLEALTRLRRHGVDGDFIRELAAVGFTKLSLDDLVQSRRHGISPDYIFDVVSLGYPHLSVDDLTLLRSHGVEAEYVRDLQRLGYTGLPPAAFAELRSHGITPNQIRSANARAGTWLSVEQLSELASHGWQQ